MGGANDNTFFRKGRIIFYVGQNKGVTVFFFEGSFLSEDGANR